MVAIHVDSEHANSRLSTIRNPRALDNVYRYIYLAGSSSISYLISIVSQLEGRSFSFLRKVV